MKKINARVYKMIFPDGTSQYEYTDKNQLIAAANLIALAREIKKLAQAKEAEGFSIMITLKPPAHIKLLGEVANKLESITPNQRAAFTNILRR